MYYSSSRDIPSLDGTSGLSENLSLGEISPIECWNAGVQALEAGHDDAEIFLKELSGESLLIIWLITRLEFLIKTGDKNGIVFLGIPMKMTKSAALEAGSHWSSFC